MEPLARSLPRHADEHARGRATFDRRAWLAGAGLSTFCWLTPLAETLARQAEESSAPQRARSLIILWLSGGPSQLETFDPHAGANSAGGTRAIPTAVSGIQLAAGLERVADQMQLASIVRSLVSKEGDHERGAYLMKTGYRPDPTVVHPSLGAIVCHQLSAGGTEIPRHVSILPDQWPARGGYLGGQFDAFKTYDPRQKVPDVAPRVAPARQDARLADRAIVEQAFARGRRPQVEATRHDDLVERARQMMSSEQLAAFDVAHEPAAVREQYGDTPFGRGCLAARRLIEQGVRCVEVTLGGWDTHANNHELHAQLVATLDPALAALLADLRERDLFDRTVVLCGGEFGRTPRINPLGGRDHHPKGFSMLLAGGGLRGGQVVGATDPEGDAAKLVDPRSVADIHATVLSALGVDPQREIVAPIGRPIKLSEGQPIEQLLS